MAKNKKKRTFTDRRWNHWRWAATGETYLQPHYERIPGFGRDFIGTSEHDAYVKEEHWGRKETCQKCAKSGEMGEFDNIPTFFGVLVFLATLAIIIGVGLLIGKLFPNSTFFH